ncbi:general stress protein [Bacillus sp. EB600]|uniref:general stress protein n=1 Tax=Bacillus sp. EB600 TaxID=2806345 RepID=UPI002108EAC9|nr:general stress protein [Bacillus sp. EB600]MCQ6279301.1 general stress protein [Bacillus sp. EB600]
MYEHEKHLVGVYDTENEAIQAVEDLKRQGYASEDISVIGKNKDEVNGINEATGMKTEEGLAAGAATGGALGGLLGLLAGVGALAIPGIGPLLAAGPIAATLTGAAVGAGAGGLAGALIGMGIPEEEADRYEGYVKEGKILVVVERRVNRPGDGPFDSGVNQKTGGATISNDPLDTPLTSGNTAYTSLGNKRDF